MLDWREFYNEYPITVWKERFDTTVAAFEAGVPAVLVSGRHGIGKTMQYGRMLVNHFSPEPEYADSTLACGTEPIIYAEPGQLIVLDEISELLTPQHSEAKAEIFRAIGNVAGIKPLVMIAPGPTRHMRRDTVEAIVDLTEQSGVKSILTLEDIAMAHVDPERALQFIHPETGEEQEELRRLLAEAPALRNPRIFKHLMASIVFNGQSVNSENVINMLEQTVRRPRHLKNLPDGGLSESIDGSLVDDTLFVNKSVSTTEAVQLYDLVGEPIPGRNHFDIDKLGFDPFKKD